ncbi:MAG: CinA family protein [Myxococcales bacterium]|nr:MAG: CinA family protein [Myxococcales bacterium]
MPSSPVSNLPAGLLWAETFWKDRLGGRLPGGTIAALPEAVILGLIARRETVATAESCTGGLAAKLATDTPGASAAFHLGVVAYDNEVKERLLKVSGKTLEKFGAVSELCVREMASGVMKLRPRATYALAISGVAGPDGGAPDKPVGAVWMALATPDGSTAECFHFPGDRDAVRLAAAYSAFGMLWEHLTRKEGANGG